MTNIEIGNLGQLLVIEEFIKNGIQCYLPYGDGSRVDLIADFNGKLNKIQIKTCLQANEDKAMMWKVGGGKAHKIYTEKEIDYFALCCIKEHIICFVPFKNQTSGITIRLDNYDNKKTYNMTFASQYTLQSILNNNDNN